MLEIANLHAGYRGNEVLHGITLHLDAGEAVCLIGPNGAGKSTVLKSVMGLTQILRGRLVWQGRDVSQLPTHALLEQGIAYVPQGRLVFPSLTVRENLEMGGYLLNHRATLRKNLAATFDRFAVLRRKTSVPAGRLSGGEQQILAIGRALMLSPKLLMLDEPSLGLSPGMTREVFEHLGAIRASGTALLIVEQNVRSVLQHVERGYLLTAGTIRCSGTARQLGDERLMHEAYLF